MFDIAWNKHLQHNEQSFDCNTLVLDHWSVGSLRVSDTFGSWKQFTSNVGLHHHYTTVLWFKMSLASSPLAKDILASGKNVHWPFFPVDIVSALHNMVKGLCSLQKASQKIITDKDHIKKNNNKKIQTILSHPLKTVSHDSSLIAIVFSNPLPSRHEIATLFSPHPYSWGLFKAAEPLKCWWVTGVGWERCDRGRGRVRVRSGRCCPHLPAPALNPLPIHKWPKFSPDGRRPCLPVACTRSEHTPQWTTHTHPELCLSRNGASASSNITVSFKSGRVFLSAAAPEERRELVCCTRCCKRRRTLLLFVECHGTRLELSHCHSVTMRQKIAIAEKHFDLDNWFKIFCVSLVSLAENCTCSFISAFKHLCYTSEATKVV